MVRIRTRVRSRLRVMVRVTMRITIMATIRKILGGWVRVRVRLALGLVPQLLS